jgi:uncharacterized protein YyaL (SSP411 family)
MGAGDRLRHFLADGEARVPALLDDYAFFGRGSLDLFYATSRPEDLQGALDCARSLLARFEDHEKGGFFLTAADAEKLIVRPRDLHDGAVPAGNSVATELMLRLYQITGDDDFRRAGEAALAAAFGVAMTNPYACAYMLAVAQQHRRGFATVVVARADGDDAGAAALVHSALHASGAETSVLVIDEPDAAWLPEPVRGKPPVSGRSAAYVCRGSVCLAPMTDAGALAAAFDAPAA